MPQWINEVPVSETAFAFQGALLCQDCGQAASEEKLVGKKYVLHHVALADRDHLYALGIRAPGKTAHLLRATVDDEGKLAELDEVEVPAAILDDYPVETLLRKAVEDGAWD